MDDLEIERKFLASPENPELQKALKDFFPNIEERYYLYRKDGIELRFTKVIKPDNKIIFQFDRMQVMATSNGSHNTRKKHRLEITAEEFEELVRIIKINESIEPIIRWSYTISENPKTEVKIYKGKFEGLIRLEIEFDSEAESTNYIKPIWFGEEITDLPIGRDTNLPDLTTEEFKQIISTLK